MIRFYLHSRADCEQRLKDKNAFLSETPFNASNQAIKGELKLKNYELLAIFKPNLDADEIDKNLAKLEETLTSYKGKVVSTEKVGRKKLSYDIQKFRDGFFVSQILALPANKVADFKRQLKLNDNVLRIMFIEADKSLAKA